MTKHYRDAATGQPDVAELRGLAEACPMPDNDPDVLSEWYELGDLTGRNYPILPIDAAFIAAASPDVVLGLLNRLDSMREAEAGLDRVAVAMGCGDEVAGYGVYREDVDGMVECARDLRERGSDHAECPRPCHCHDDRLAYPVSCEPCKGSGCGPGTASGAYEPCDHCDGTGADCSKGWAPVVALEATESELAHMREARDNARAEVERLTALVDAVRALHQPKPYADADMRAIAPSLPAEVCGDCWGRGDSAVPWPCPTARALDEEPQP